MRNFEEIDDMVHARALDRKELKGACKNFNTLIFVFIQSKPESMFGLSHPKALSDTSPRRWNSKTLPCSLTVSCRIRYLGIHAMNFCVSKQWGRYSFKLLRQRDVDQLFQATRITRKWADFVFRKQSGAKIGSLATTGRQRSDSLSSLSLKSSSFNLGSSYNTVGTFLSCSNLP